MRIFLDSADINEIERCVSTGLVSGCTTNPTLIRKSGRDPIEVYKDIQSLGVEDISMEVYGDYKEMVTQAAKLGELMHASDRSPGSVWEENNWRVQSFVWRACRSIRAGHHHGHFTTAHDTTGPGKTQRMIVRHEMSRRMTCRP